MIVAAGGDGTLNEIVNGLREDASAIVLGLIPLGTGNDFARTGSASSDRGIAWRSSDWLHNDSSTKRIEQRFVLRH